MIPHFPLSLNKSLLFKCLQYFKRNVVSFGVKSTKHVFPQNQLQQWIIKRTWFKICTHSHFYLSWYSTRQSLDLRLWTSPCLQQDPLRPPPPRRRLPQRDLSGPFAAGWVIAVMGWQPALHGRNSHCACDHSNRDGHSCGCCGDGREEQEEEQRKEIGCWITDINIEPDTEESSFQWQGCGTLNDIKQVLIYILFLWSILNLLRFTTYILTKTEQPYKPLLFMHNLQILWVPAHCVSMELCTFYM